MPTPQTIADARRLVADHARSMLFESSATHPSAHNRTHNRTLLFRDPLRWIEVHTLSDLPSLFAAIDAALSAGHWAAGYFSYECGFQWEPTACPNFTPQPKSLPLAVFGIYADAVPCTRSSPTDLAQPEPLEAVSLSLTPEQYAAQFEQVQQWIRAGDIYQLNLTAELRAPVPRNPSALFAHMMQAQPVDFGAFLHLTESQHILSASPELFFHQQQRQITVRPMKGTAPRGQTPADDDRIASTLASDEKNRAENVMIVDLLRNDLGRIAEFGSVEVRELFAIDRLPSLLQMSSEIHATLRPEVTPQDIFAALFPSGSITGAPKVHAMQLIHQLEQRDRGPYTGAIGFFSPRSKPASSHPAGSHPASSDPASSDAATQAEAVFSVAIRTCVLNAGQLAMGIGSGLVADSEPTAEYNECLLKAAFLRDPDFGLIETMRWQNGRCDLLPLHLDRLESSAAALHIPFTREAIAAALQTHTAALDANTIYKLRLVLNPRGQTNFNPPEPIADNDTPSPLRITLWPEPISSTNPLLRHKTTRRAVYNTAYAQARAAGFADAIFTNEYGHLTEGAIHSLFLRHGDQWRTPPLTEGVLPGVFRRHMLDTNPQIREATLTLADLKSADEIHLTNAVRGIRKVCLAS